LFRLWNIAEYWFPYRDLVKENWDGVLREFIPRLAAADTRDAYHLEMIALIAHMHDGHANLWGSLDVRPPRGDGQFPVEFRFLGDRLVVSGYSDSELGRTTGLRPGDIIRDIDGVQPETQVASWRPLYAASNEAAQRRDIAASIGRGDSHRTATITFERDGRTSEVTVARVATNRLRSFVTHDHAGETFQRLSDDLAYLKLSSVRAAECAEYIRKAAGTKCLIIDIRNYPSEFVVFTLGGHLVAKPTPFVTFTNADASNPGSFMWTPAPLQLSPIAPRFEGHVAILVDEVTQSQAEYTAMAFRSAPGAVVVGSTTAGADGNVSTIPLPGGIRGMMSGIGVYYPDHRPTQRIGIVPDVVAMPTPAGLAAGRDEVLEAAVRHVLKREITDAERRSLGAAQ
jgi:C-terminal processing protease CtpA/Prc